MVYPLAKLLGEHTRLSPQELKILHAAAILHDTAIKYCKEHHHGDASQEKQKRKPPDLSEAFCPRPIIRHPMFPVSLNWWNGTMTTIAREIRRCSF